MVGASTARLYIINASRMYNVLSLLLVVLSCTSNTNLLLVNGEDTEGDTGTSAPTATPWKGCVTPGSDATIRKGEQADICFTLGPATNWAEGITYMRWIFSGKVDEYSRFHVPKSYDQLLTNDAPAGLDKNLTVHAAVQTKLSYLRLYYDPSVQDNKSENDKIFPYLTAIVDVKDGVVKGIAWDDSCVFCGNKRCQENTYNFAGESSDTFDLNENTKGCYLTRSECNEILANDPSATDCDLTLHVVWTGSDSDGESLLSSASRYSAFPPARLQDRVKIPDVTGSIQDKINSVNPFDGDETEGGTTDGDNL